MQVPPGSCYNCGAPPDHYANNCPHPKRQIGYVPQCGECKGQGHLPGDLRCPAYVSGRGVRFANPPHQEIPRRPGTSTNQGHVEESHVLRIDIDDCPKDGHIYHVELGDHEASTSGRKDDKRHSVQRGESVSDLEALIVGL